MDIMTDKWQSRIGKRRNENRDVLGYVNGLIRDNHVILEEVAATLTPDELQQIKDTLAERARKEADEKARWEAESLERKRKDEENQRRLAAFWEKNSPSPLTTAPDIQTESELFDVLARYHITRVEYSFAVVRYHWDRLDYIEDPSIEAWLPSDIAIDLQTELPGDDDGDLSIGEAIYESVKESASQRAAIAADEGRLQEGKVIFDVPARHISVEATIEVIREERLERVWAADET
jgi:hypothetical protein